MAQLTQAQFQSILASVRSVGMDYEAMAEAIDFALFMAATDGSTSIILPVTTVTSDGTSINSVSLAEAIMLAAYFRQRACGGHYSQPLEFDRY